MESPRTKSPAGYSAEDAALADRLIAEKYDTLQDIARAKRRRANVGDTMRTCDLLHESWLRLDGKREWRSEEHFIRAATLAMRHVIIDYARRKLAAKRGGGAEHESYDNEATFPEFAETPDEVIVIGQLMERLEAINPRWMLIVDARYFAGMTEEETADALALSPRTVRRDWKAARTWMGKQMGVSA